MSDGTKIKITTANRRAAIDGVRASEPRARAKEQVQPARRKQAHKFRIPRMFGKLSVFHFLKKERGAASDARRARAPRGFFTRLSISEQVHFAKRLAFLVRSGIPVLESLHVLRAQTRSRSRARIFDSLIDDVSNGRFLSAGLDRFCDVFGAFAVNVVRVGEMSGSLAENLVYLSEELEKRAALKRKILGAMVYPLFITVATIGISALLTVYIFPKVMPIFTSLNVELPLSTRALLAASLFLREHGIATLVCLAALVALVLSALRFSARTRLIAARLVIRVPIVGRLIKEYNLATICRTLGLLLKSGFTVVEGLAVTGDATANPLYQHECRELGECTVRGERLSARLEKSRSLFPDMARHLIAIGETSGSLSQTLIYLAEHYETEVDEAVKNLSSLVEPALMVFMGLVVGCIAVSVITPIYEVTQHLSR